MPPFEQNRADKLYVITTYWNPLGLKSRHKLYLEFVNRIIKTSGAEIVAVELNHTEQDCNVPGLGLGPKVYSPDVLYYKQNLINIALKHLPAEARYVAWMDCDIAFVRPDWVQATIAALQDFDIVQMFSQVRDLDINYEESEVALYSAVYLASHPLTGQVISPTDFAWAANRNFLGIVGGLVDEVPTVTSSDNLMASILLGGRAGLQKEISWKYPLMPIAFFMPWFEWLGKVMDFDPRVGYVPGLIHHYYHGKRSNRGYEAQWGLAQRYGSDLKKWLYRDGAGLWRWRDPNCGYAAELRAWFEARREDE